MIDTIRNKILRRGGSVATAMVGDERAAGVDEGSAGDTPEDDEEQDRKIRPRGCRHKDRDAKKGAKGC